MIFHARRADGTEMGEFTEYEFQRLVFSGEIDARDYYWREGMSDWAPAGKYKMPGSPKILPPVTRHGGQALAATTPTAIKKTKRKDSPASIGAACAVAAVFAPLLNGGLFFLVSLPLLVTAFVLAIVSLVQVRILGGILLLMGLVIAGPMSCSMMVDRDKFLHDPGAFAREAKAKEAIERAARER